MKELLSNLNRQQLAAVTHQGGHELVVAGAGTGKTRVLTTRIAWLISEGLARPAEIMALTFTNKAAKEMKERLGKLIGPNAETLTIGTFHAVCGRILRQYGSAIDIDRDYIIYDTYDQTSIIKQLLKSMGLDPKNVSAPAILGKIDDFKNKGLFVEKAAVDEFDLMGSYALKLYEPYQKALRRAGALDFGDLLLECLRLWQQDGEVMAYFRRRYRYVLVDEFQDTNEVQLELLRQLAFGPDGSNIFAVGDDDQSIYSWRGASPANMSHFESFFPGATIYKLEENYRSTCGILDAANLLIEKNMQRRPKKLFSQDLTAEKPELILAPDAEDEAAMVVGRIMKLVNSGAADPGDFAIIMRTNAQSRPFEQVLRTAALPYTVVGGMAFFARQEVKDLLACLRLIFWPGSDADFQRVLLRLTAGVGETTIDKLMMAAASANTTVGNILAAGEAALKGYGFTKRAVGPLLQLQHSLDDLRALAAEATPQEVARQTLETMGILQSFHGDPHEEERQENIDEMLRLIALRHEEGQDLPTFLAQASIDEFNAQKKGEHSGTITLSTIHAAKGLEFPLVFLVGLEEGLLPHANSLRAADHAPLGEGDKYIEEERRLCYVGVTRARKKLYISAASRRLSAKGGYHPTSISRFIGEMDLDAHPLAGQGRAYGHINPAIQRRLHMGGHLDIDLEDDDDI